MFFRVACRLSVYAALAWCVHECVISCHGWAINFYSMHVDVGTGLVCMDKQVLYKLTQSRIRKNNCPRWDFEPTHMYIIHVCVRGGQ